jgi:hypothetical protein
MDLFMSTCDSSVEVGRLISITLTLFLMDNLAIRCYFLETHYFSTRIKIYVYLPPKNRSILKFLLVHPASRIPYHRIYDAPPQLEYLSQNCS